MRNKLIISLISLSFIYSSFVNSQSVISTKHNLSFGGDQPGKSTSTSDNEVCSYCHTPHKSNGASPQWNSNDKGKVYIIYNSTTMKAMPGQPDGSSILCLSCHDGTIASRKAIDGSNPSYVNNPELTTGRGNLSTDLRNDHPISFIYNSTVSTLDGQLKNPVAITPPVKLENNKMQCTSCHDPHKNTTNSFLVTTSQFSNLCNSCHQVNNWTTSSHNTSSKIWNGISPNPWPFTPWKTVTENACENCHNPHNSSGVTRLLKYQAEENNCFDCHNGNVAIKNMQAEFSKTYKHNVFAYNNMHDPTEPNTVISKHVECVDCHNPHQSKEMQTTAPDVKGANIGTNGISQTGTSIKNVSNEYEICYRCHADNPATPSPTPRVIEQNNVRLEFAQGNPSYHSVAATGVNPNVPSLIAPLTSNSRIYCTDCHGNNESTGPKGPHGSIYPQILKSQYIRTDNTPYNSSNYALCFNCHSKESIMADESFKYHSLHINSVKTPCNTCHDPHGISSSQGNSINNSNLINFNSSIVSNSSSGLRKFEDKGLYSGKCYLTCHGKNHNPLEY